MDMNSTALFSMLGTWALLPTILTILTILVHIAFSAAVFTDAQALKKENNNLVFTGPVIWSLAVIVGGVFVALAYWVMHHSSLRKW